MAASIFNGNAVKILKEILRFKSGIEIITNDSDDPTVVAKSAPQSSVYLRAGTDDIYVKNDSGSSTNWTKLLSAADLSTYVVGPGSATDNALARFDGTTGKLLQNSGATLSDTGDLLTTSVETTGDLDVGANATFGGTVLLNQDASLALEAVTKQQLDAAVGGVDVKEAVEVATTADITLSGEQTIDGVLTSASRVLVKNQATQTENGIYVTAAGAWSRAADANTSSELDSALVTVKSGTANANTGWYQTTNNPNVGVDNIIFQQFFGAGTYTADGQGIELIGSTFSLELDGSTLSKSASGLKVNQISNSEIAAGANIALSKLAALTANRALQSDGSGVVSVSAVTSTELGYVSGVTSSIQTQLDGKLGTVFTAEGQLIVSNNLNAPVTLNVGTANSVLTSNGTTPVYSLITNSNIDAAAAIAYSKLNLASSIVNADISASAAIAYSKLNLASSIVNADISASAAIAYSKLNLASSIVDADVAAGAAIAYSKLNLASSIVNADIAAGAAIAYSKLNLASSIVNADVAAGAAISLSKLAALTVSRALVSDGSGVVSVSSVTSTELGYVSGVTSNIQTQLDGKVSSREISGTRQTANNVSASTTITPTASRDLVYFATGNGGAVTVTASPPITTTGMSTGQVVTIVGCSDTNTVTYTTGNNLQLNGDYTLGKDSTLTVMYMNTDGTNAAWVEIGRN